MKFWTDSLTSVFLTIAVYSLSDFPISDLTVQKSALVAHTKGWAVQSCSQRAALAVPGSGSVP